MSAILLSLILIGTPVEPAAETTSQFSNVQIEAYNTLLFNQQMILDQPKFQVAMALLFGLGGVMAFTGTMLFVFDRILDGFLARPGTVSPIGIAGLVVAGGSLIAFISGAFPASTWAERRAEVQNAISQQGWQISGLPLGLLCEGPAERFLPGATRRRNLAKDSLCLMAIEVLTGQRWFQTPATEQMVAKRFYKGWKLESQRLFIQGIAGLVTLTVLITTPSIISIIASFFPFQRQLLIPGLLLALGAIPIFGAIVGVVANRVQRVIGISRGAQIAFGKQSLTAMVLPDFSLGGPGFSVGVRY